MIRPIGSGNGKVETSGLLSVDQSLPAAAIEAVSVFVPAAEPRKILWIGIKTNDDDIVQELLVIHATNKGVTQPTEAKTIQATRFVLNDTTVVATTLPFQADPAVTELTLSCGVTLLHQELGDHGGSIRVLDPSSNPAAAIRARMNEIGEAEWKKRLKKNDWELAEALQKKYRLATLLEIADVKAGVTDELFDRRVSRISFDLGVAGISVTEGGRELRYHLYDSFAAKTILSHVVGGKTLHTWVQQELQSTAQE